MNYTEALKKVQAKKPRENYMVVEFSYNCKLVVPYKDGAALISALTHAEQLSDSYSSSSKGIQPIDLHSVRSYVMSGQEYEQHKMAALLNVSIEEIKKAAEQATNPTQ